MSVKSILSKTITHLVPMSSEKLEWSLSSNAKEGHSLGCVSLHLCLDFFHRFEIREFPV